VLSMKPFPRKKVKNLFSFSSRDSECFSTDSQSMNSEEETAKNDWDVAGAFPRILSTSSSSQNSSKNHIFTDEPFDTDFEGGLEVVPEGSTCSEDLSREESALGISPTTRETQQVDNRKGSSNTQRQAVRGQSLDSTSRFGSSQSGGPTGSNKYPFNIQDSLGKRSPTKSRLNQDDATQEASLSPTKRGPSDQNRSLAQASFGTAVNNGNLDVEGQESMPSPLTPMTFGEGPSSVTSNERSEINEPTRNIFSAPHSVVSAARSQARHKKYLVRYTLSTSQQVNANPSTMLKNIFIGIEQERHMHKLAAQNLRAVHNWFLFVPCIVLTLLSGLTVLTFEADLDIPADAQIYSSIAVGVAALMGVFLQAVSKMLDLGTRGTIHDITAATMKRLSEEILLTLSSTEAITAEYVALISEKLGQALDGCTSPIPYKLEAAYSSVSDRMVLMLRPPAGQPARKHLNKLDYMRLYSTLYDELNTEIIHFWAWPFMFPRPRSASEAALRHFKAIITEGREAVNRKPRFFRLCCPCWGEVAVERSLFEVVPPASVDDSSQTTAYNYHAKYLYPVRSSAVGHEV